MTYHSPSAVRCPVFVWLDWPPFVEVHLFGDLSLTKGHCGSFVETSFPTSRTKKTAHWKKTCFRRSWLLIFFTKSLHSISCVPERFIHTNVGDLQIYQRFLGTKLAALNPIWRSGAKWGMNSAFLHFSTNLDDTN